MNDLIVAVIRHEGDKFRHRFAEALSGSEPLRETLALAVEASSISYELMALALKNKAIAAELKRDAEALRKIETDALVRNLEMRGIRPEVSPIATAYILRATIAALAIEAELGVSDGHAETQAFIEEWLQSYTTAGKLPHADHKKLQPASRKRKVGVVSRIRKRQTRTAISKRKP